MSRSSSVLLTIAMSAMVAGCPKHDLTPPESLADLAVHDMTIAPNTDLNKGRCYRTTPSSCSDDDGCHSWFTCQEGMCCTGILIPGTCTCGCAGGPPCGSNWFCCRGLNDAGVLDDLRCRPYKECE